MNPDFGPRANNPLKIRPEREAGAKNRRRSFCSPFDSFPLRLKKFGKLPIEKV
jgi:hypothetical protein